MGLARRSLPGATRWAVAVALLVATGCRSAALSAARTAGAPSDATEPTHVRVLNLNAWMLPGFSEVMSDRLARLPAALLKEQADVICLQEIWTPSVRTRLVEGLGPGHNASSSVRGGLVTLSRHPIVEQEFLAFPIMKGLAVQELVAGKGILLTVLEVPGGRLRVANTHLAWDPKPEGARTHQLAYLRKTLEALEDLPLVLSGDLNTALNEQEGGLTAAGEALQALGFAHADPLAGGRLGDLPADVERPSLIPTRVGWPPEPRSGWTPDHILCRDGLWRTTMARGYRVILATSDEALSDHSGLCVDLVLAP